MRYAYALLLVPFLFGATYYVASDGSGSYATYSAANAVAVSGDIVSGKRGDTFREQITPISGVTYNAYGIGAKPKIFGSKQENELTDWTDEGDNIWSNNDASFTVDVGNIIFDNEESCGVKVKEEGELTTQDYFWYDTTNHLIKIYSVGNPAYVHTNIECALKLSIFSGSSSYVIIENIDLRYGGAHGIDFFNSQNNIVRNCDVSYIGGGDQINDYTTRYGNGIQLWGSSSNITVENCRLSNIYDAALTAQSSARYGTVVMRNIVLNNNIIDKSEYSYEYFNSNSTSISQNIQFIHNTCKNAGSGWGHNQRWDNVNGRHLMLSTNNASTSELIIKNNIFDTATESGIRFYDDTFIDDYFINNNVWNCSVLSRVENTNYTTLSDWQSATGQDLHSIASDPLLGIEYRPKGASPCRDAGVDLDIETDYYGHFRDDTPTIGAVEFGTFLGNFTSGNVTFGD